MYMLQGQKKRRRRMARDGTKWQDVGRAFQPDTEGGQTGKPDLRADVFAFFTVTATMSEEVRYE
jgi:hypothetical protein